MRLRRRAENRSLSACYPQSEKDLFGFEEHPGDASKFRNTCCGELNPERLTPEFFRVDQNEASFQSRTEVSLHCQIFTIEEFP
jgi:hypothetical protein